MSNTDNQNVYRPCLVQGKKVIASIFRVHPNTVAEWVHEGAPITHVGGMWQVDYERLMDWLIVHKSAKAKMTS